MGGLTAVFSGLFMVVAAGLALRLLTRPPRRRAGPDAGPQALRAQRRRRRRRAVMVAGTVLVAGAFFVGVNFIAYDADNPEGQRFFAAYWSIVLIVTLGLLILGLVDFTLTRRWLSRSDVDAATRHRQNHQSTGKPRGEGDRDNGAS